MASNNNETTFTIRIPEHFLDKLHTGEITASMLLTLSILYRWASWTTGIVPHASAGGLHTWSRGAYSIRTFQEDLRRLEKKRVITRQNIPGVKGDYSIILHNYPYYHKDTGKTTLLNAVPTSCSQTSTHFGTDAFSEVSTDAGETKPNDSRGSVASEASSRTDDCTEASTHPRTETSDKVLSNNESENESKNNSNNLLNTTSGFAAYSSKEEGHSFLICKTLDLGQGNRTSPDPHSSDRPTKLERSNGQSPDPYSSDEPTKSEENDSSLLTHSLSVSRSPAAALKFPTQPVGGITPDRMRQLTNYIYNHPDDPSYDWYVTRRNLNSRLLAIPAKVLKLESDLGPRMEKAESEAQLMCASPQAHNLETLFMSEWEKTEDERSAITQGMDYLLSRRIVGGGPFKSKYGEVKWLLKFMDKHLWFDDWAVYKIDENGNDAYTTPEEATVNSMLNSFVTGYEFTLDQAILCAMCEKAEGSNLPPSVDQQTPETQLDA